MSVHLSNIKIYVVYKYVILILYYLHAFVCVCFMLVKQRTTSFLQTHICRTRPFRHWNSIYLVWLLHVVSPSQVNAITQKRNLVQKCEKGVKSVTWYGTSRWKRLFSLRILLIIHTFLTPRNLPTHVFIRK